MVQHNLVEHRHGPTPEYKSHDHSHILFLKSQQNFQYEVVMCRHVAALSFRLVACMSDVAHLCPCTCHGLESVLVNHSLLQLRAINVFLTTLVRNVQNTEKMLSNM